MGKKKGEEGAERVERVEGVVVRAEEPGRARARDAIKMDGYRSVLRALAVSGCVGPDADRVLEVSISPAAVCVCVCCVCCVCVVCVATCVVCLILWTYDYDYD